MGQFNQLAVERAVYDLLIAIGEDPSRPGLRDTPRRVAEMYYELLHYQDTHLTAFPNEEKYDQMIIVRHIPFWSLCEHHLLPFGGYVSVGYIPTNKLLGLSKLIRIVEVFAHRLQLQERMTQQIANTIQQHINPLGCGVLVEAEHLCMSARGVKKQGHRTITSALKGVLLDKPEARMEFLRLCGYK